MFGQIIELLIISVVQDHILLIFMKRNGTRETSLDILIMLCFNSEVFPYLVIVVGVENILVITKSVVSTPVDLEVKIRVAQGINH